MAAQNARPRLPRASKGNDGELDWQDISQTRWLQHMVPATTEDDAMEDRYIIVADPKATKVAILGLCRKIEV